MRTSIKERFEGLRNIITKQETQMLSKFEIVFMEEKAKLQNMLSNTESSDLANSVKKKLKEFYDVKSNPNIVKMIEEDFTDLEKSVNEKLAISTAKHQEELSELLAIFQKSLPDGNLLKQFDVAGPLTQNLTEYNTKREFNSEEQIKHIKEVVIPSVELNISLDADDHLLTVSEYRSPQSFKFDRSQLEQVQQVHYTLMTEEHADDRVLPALIWLSKFLSNIKSIKFSFQTSLSFRDVPENRSYSILSATLSQPENLERIEIETSSSSMSDLGLIYLAEKVLPRIKDLKAFTCLLYKTKITGQVLQAFAQANFAARPNLESFGLNIAGASLKEEDIIAFLKTVPNAKDLLLGFGQTVLSDQALEDFSTNVLPSLNKIERFELGFWDTKLTGVGIKKFLMNAPSTIQKFLIGMERLDITDDAFESFLNGRLLAFTNLQELNFGLSGTEISENMSRQISRWKEKITRVVSHNNISDDEGLFSTQSIIGRRSRASSR